MTARLNFYFTEAVRSLTTNFATSVAATVTMLFTLLIVGTFTLLLALPVRQTANQVGSQAGTASVYLNDDIKPDQVNAIKSELQNDPNVAKVTFVSKADALNRAKKLFSQEPDVMKAVPPNTFPASFEATLKDPRQISNVVKGVEHMPGVNNVNKPSPFTKRVIKVAHVIEVGLVIGSLLLIVVSVILVANTVRLSIFSRRAEIEVMKLVGASNSFVRMPFVIEGLICGLIAAVVAVLLTLGLVHATSGIFNDLSLWDVVSRNEWRVAGSLIGGGVLLGALGSGVTIRRYLLV